MSKFFDVESTLIRSFRALDSSTPTSYPGMDEEPDVLDDSTLWIRLHNLRSPDEPITLGDQGEDEASGIFQIDINVPKGKGSGVALAKADALAAAYSAGKSYTYNGQTVKFRGVSLTAGRYAGGYYRVSLSVRYYARYKRNP